MASNLIYQNSGGTAELPAPDFLNVDPGTNSAAIAFRLFNDDTGGAVDEATDPVITLRQDDGSGNAVLLGLRAINERWIQVRALGTGSSGSTQPLTGWTALGRGRTFTCAPLPSGEYHNLEIRYSPPATAPAGQILFLMDTEPGPVATFLEQGHSDNWRDGILSGIGDGSWDEIILGGDVVEDDAGAGADVDIPDLVWRIDGVYQVKLAHEITTNDTDGDAATTSAGEAYYLLLTLASDGTITQTKGGKATAPLDPATDAPAAPVGEIQLALIERNDDGVINDADITQLSSVGGFKAVHTTGSLNITLGPGRAFVDNALARRGVDTAITLTASVTNSVWILPDGTFSVETDSTVPDPMALKIYELVTDGSGVTSEVDLREGVGGEIVPIVFNWTTVADTTAAYAVQPRGRSVHLRPVRGCVFALHTNGSGNTTGITAVDVEKSVAGGAYVDLFTSNATDDRRPTVEHDDTDIVDRLALPEVTEIEPHALLRATIDRTEAYDGTAPADGATLILLCEMF